MALKGNLKDFNISNILQMIKMEDKTGTLDVRSESDSIHISFESGKVVYAYSEKFNEEKKFKYGLILNRIISKENWASAKKDHDQTLRPYWEILKKFVEPQFLSKFMTLQITDTVYQLLRWAEGQYEFLPQNKVPFDAKLIQPMDVDFLLMEGSRVTDEWNHIKRLIPPMDAVIRKNILEGEGLKEALQGQEINPKAKSMLEEDILESRKIKITENEKKVLALLLQDTPVEILFYSSVIGQFETGEALVSLLKRNLLRLVKKKEVEAVGESKTRDHLKKAVYAGILVLWVLLIGAGLYFRGASLPLQGKDLRGLIGQLGRYQVRQEMMEIVSKLQIYYAMEGKFPDSLDPLVQAGLLDKNGIYDPWKKPYVFQIHRDRFSLYSTGPDGAPSGDDIYFERFGPFKG